MVATLSKYIPGLKIFHSYQREWWQADLMAGVSVAAVALPVGIAYAQLAGLPPVVGIYSSIFPAVAYAFFGSSKQLVVNPDSAACMMVASTIAPLAAGDALRNLDLAILLTFMTGVLCLVGGIAKLGVIANFLSRPILTGYLNGIAFSIMASQLGTLLGFKIPRGGFFYTLWQGISRLSETHFASLILGLSLFALIRLMKRLTPKLPAPLFATVAGILAVTVFALPGRGVATVGQIPAGLPVPRIPSFAVSELVPLFSGACGIVLVSFCSMMTTARAFAIKNGYPIKVNQDMFALGISDLAAAVGSGFAVSGADSRTAVADASGGKSQVTSIVAAIMMALVLLFLARPLSYVPAAALAAILISSALGLFDIASLRRYYSFSKSEFWFSIIAMLGVMTIGVLPGVLVAVALAIIKLLQRASHPHDAVLSPVSGLEGVYTSSPDEEHDSLPGVLIYRFDAALLFFNADYFKDRVQLALSESGSKPDWFIFNTEAVPLIDITGCEALEEVRRDLENQGIVMVVARAKGMFLANLKKSGLWDSIGKTRFFYSVHAAVLAYQLEHPQTSK
jgi:high affinity sulfate transporter 1